MESITKHGDIDKMLTSSTEAEEQTVCIICEKPIGENDTFEITEIYLDGNFEDMSHVHTDCRYNHDKKKEKALDKIESIQIYVRMLQDGDPENENPKQILDYIEKEVDDVLVQEST